MEKKAKVSFILPGIPWSQSGGGKVVYRYANFLAERGSDVKIYFYTNKTWERLHLPQLIKRTLIKTATKIINGKELVDRRVEKKAIFDITDEAIEDADLIFATAYPTAYPVSLLSDNKGEKWYFIQDHEVWGRSESDVNNAYRLMNNLATAKWLKRIVDVSSLNPCVYLPIGIDTKTFHINKNPKDRNKYVIGALYNTREHKGFPYTLQTAERLKKKYDNIKLILFGREKKPDSMPEWMVYHENPTTSELVDIYNSISIFICSSIKEGFGLTGAESMACGCAFCSTTYDGVFEYAVNGENALLSKPRDVESMVGNVSLLIEDDEERNRISMAGRNTVENMNWENSFRIFEEEILKSREI